MKKISIVLIGLLAFSFTTTEAAVKVGYSVYVDSSDRQELIRNTWLTAWAPVMHEAQTKAGEEVEFVRLPDVDPIDLSSASRIIGEIATRNNVEYILQMEIAASCNWDTSGSSAQIIAHMNLYNPNDYYRSYRSQAGEALITEVTKYNPNVLNKAITEVISKKEKWVTNSQSYPPNFLYNTGLIKKL